MTSFSFIWSAFQDEMRELGERGKRNLPLLAVLPNSLPTFRMSCNHIDGYAREV
jgi:hypothetical protein